MTTVHEVVDEEWPRLTVVPAKVRLYGIDPYFRQSFADGRRILGGTLFGLLHRVGLVVLKPESIAGRRGADVLAFLHDAGFTPVIARPFAFDRHMVTELWRYQWNAATLDKMEVAGRVNTGRPTVLMVVRDDAPVPGLPAPVRLKSLKGAADPAARTDPRSLRSVLRAPNRLITFVHMADEPADVVRELGVFYDTPARRELYAAVRDALGGNVAETARALVEAVERDAPRADFDVDAAWTRLLATARPRDAAAFDVLRQMHEAFARDRTLDWGRFAALCDAVGAEEWDVLGIATGAVESDLATREQLVSFGERDITRWREAAGSPVVPA